MKVLTFTQIVCIIIIIFGIAVEFIYQASLGFIAITLGSLLFAITTKIENYLLTKRKD